MRGEGEEEKKGKKKEILLFYKLNSIVRNTLNI